MKIETKYNIGDKVYYLSNNSVVTNNVLKITVTVEQFAYTKVTIRYSVDVASNTRLESDLFRSKEDLINSL